MTEMQIKKTTNYGQFKNVRGNRDINRRHLNKLVKSIEENDLLEANPIIVNEKMYILDGQHRLLAAEKLGVPIYYVVVAMGGISEVQLLNSNLRTWTMTNFLNSYIERGNPEYITIREFMDKTGLGLGIAVFLLSGGRGGSYTRKEAVNDFKGGDFKASHKQFAEEMYRKLTELASFCDDNSWNKREFVSSLTLVGRAGITHETLLAKLKGSGRRIPRLATRRQYIRFLEDVLSYKAKTPVRLI